VTPPGDMVPGECWVWKGEYVCWGSCKGGSAGVCCGGRVGFCCAIARFYTQRLGLSSPSSTRSLFRLTPALRLSLRHLQQSNTVTQRVERSC